MTPNGVIVSPCSYVLSPGDVITGAVFGGSTTVDAAVTAIVNVDSTAEFTPSSARTVTVYDCADAPSDTVP
ncbi:MAG: hypothetical protein F4X11_02700 [Acidobacteria bacterium]|nr:hypothetical protein [Acidobacteriota bacterium]